MNKQTVKRLMVKGVMTYVAVFALVLMVAMPALALMVNSVGTREIIDHSIRSRDLRNKSVTTDRIAPRAVRRGKIAKRAIRNEHIYNNINDSKIRYSTKTKVMTIPAAAFSPRGGTSSFELKNTYLRADSTVTAPVLLPSGARVTKVEVLGRMETGGSAKFSALLASATDIQSQSRVYTTMATMAAPDTSIAWWNLSTTTIADPVINNATKQYFLQASPVPYVGPFCYVARARITYTIAGP